MAKIEVYCRTVDVFNPIYTLMLNHLLTET